MPYQPGIQYTGHNAIQEGMRQGGQNLLALLTGAAQKKDDAAKLAKEEKKLFDSYVTQGVALGFNKDALSTKSIGEVQGIVDGEKLKRAIQAQDQQIKNQGLQASVLEKQLEGAGFALDQQKALPKFYDSLTRALPPEGTTFTDKQAFAPGAGPADAQAFQLKPEHIFSALRESGYAPKPEELDGFVRSITPKGTDPISAMNAKTAQLNALTAQRNAETASTKANKPAATGPDKPQEIMIGNKATGWAQFPDGRYRLLKKDDDKIDASQFDSDGDGILSETEFAKAILAQKLGGSFFPGMKVNKSVASKPTNTKDPLGLFGQ